MMRARRRGAAVQPTVRHGVRKIRMRIILSPSAATRLELRLAGVTHNDLAGHGAAAADVGCLLARVEAELDRAAVDDRAAVFRFAADACRAGGVRLAAMPLVLLDITLDSRAEREFV